MDRKAKTEAVLLRALKSLASVHDQGAVQYIDNKLLLHCISLTNVQYRAKFRCKIQLGYSKGGSIF